MSVPATASIVAVKPSAREEVDVHGGKALWKPLVTLTCKNRKDIYEGPGS